MPAKNNWTREELILAFNLYCKIPFVKINSSNKDIHAFANIIGRSHNAVALRLANFARLDPSLKDRGVSGMGHGSKGEEEIWKEFNNDWERLGYESELLLARYKKVPVEKLLPDEQVILSKRGEERESLVKVRVNQSFFRNTVLASYNNQCCMTGLAIPDLLVASHIVPWSHDVECRVNPHNGLCLNALHDRAFDKGLITVTPDLKIHVSSTLLKKTGTTLETITELNGQYLIKPQRFLPLTKYLSYHNNEIFKP